MSARCLRLGCARTPCGDGVPFEVDVRVPVHARTGKAVLRDDLVIRLGGSEDREWPVTLSAERFHECSRLRETDGRVDEEDAIEWPNPAHHVGGGDAVLAAADKRVEMCRAEGFGFAHDPLRIRKKFLPHALAHGVAGT